MSKEEEYELLPHEEIQKLRDELAKFKDNPLGNTPLAQDLRSAVVDLTKAIVDLKSLFVQTNDDLVKEFQRTSISENFSVISSQNEQIAQGILSVANLISSNQSQDVVSKTPPPDSTLESPDLNTSSVPLNQDFNELNVSNNSQAQPVQPLNSFPDSFGSDQMSSNSMPPPMPNFDLPPPPKKKSGLMGMFK